MKPLLAPIAILALSLPLAQAQEAAPADAKVKVAQPEGPSPEELEKEAQELDDLFTKLAELLLNAEKASQLDAPLKDIVDRSGRSHYTYSSIQPRTTSHRLNRMRAYVPAASQVIVHWQDYLMAIETSNLESAKRSLSSLKTQIAQFPYVPRSKVLALAANLESPVPATGQAKFTPPTLEGYKKRLTSFEAAQQVHRELASSSLRSKHGLDTFYRGLDRCINGINYLNRRSYSSGFSSLREFEHDKTFKALVNPALLQAARTSLGIPEEFESKEHELVDELVNRYLRSISGDTEKLWASLKTARDFHSSGTKRTAIDNNIKAIEFLLAAQSYEKQKLYARAIVAYRQTIGANATFVSKDLAGDAMRRLKKEHPQDADLAETMTSHVSSRRSTLVTSRLTTNQLHEIAAKVEELIAEREKRKGDE